MSASTSSPSSSSAIRTSGHLTHPSLPTHVHIALAQLLPISPSEETGHDAGLSKLRAYVSHAASLGADVIAFPEYYLAGADHEDWYAVRERGGPRPHHGGKVREEEEQKHWLDLVCAEAKKHDINIVAGTVVELGHQHHVPHRAEVKRDGKGENGEEEEESLFNTAYFVGREGEVRGKYTKRNLWHPERAPLTPGHSATHPSPLTFTFTTRRHPTRPISTALQICWDLANPDSFRSLVRSSPQPEIVFVPTCWYATDAGREGLSWGNPFEGEGVVVDGLTVARSLECESVVAMTNVAGEGWPRGFVEGWEREVESGEMGGDGQRERRLALVDEHIIKPNVAVGLGRSSLVSPFTGVIARLEDAEEGLLLGTVDLRMIEDIRKTYQIREDLLAADGEGEEEEAGKKRKTAA